jgi:hypothetical protein
MHVSTFERLLAKKAALEASGVRELGWLFDEIVMQRQRLRGVRQRSVNFPS